MLRQISIFALLTCALVPAVADAGPIAGPDGVLRYPFGERTPPTLRCKPLFVCDLVLEPGETIVNVAVGDSVRWLIAPASSGGGDGATPHVLVKPTEAGLRTNLIVTTNRRTYYLTLVSSYNYPDAADRLSLSARSAAGLRNGRCWARRTRPTRRCPIRRSTSSISTTA